MAPNRTGRLVQAVNDGGFEIEAKFRSIPTEDFQVLGLMVEDGPTSYLRLEYHRDGLGRIVDIEETNQGTTTTIGYTYDELGQLVQVTRDGLVTETYAYDDNGNRVAVDTPSDTFSGTQIVYNLDESGFLRFPLADETLPLGPSRGLSNELLEPTADDSPVAKFLERNGPGIHHVAYEVSDLEQRLAALKAEGGLPVLGGPCYTSTVQSFF